SYKINDKDEIEIFADLKERIVAEKIKPIISKEQINKFLSSIIFEDENIIAINKPSGLSVQGRSVSYSSIDEMLPALKKEGKNLHLVHRLDRDTSGVLILAKNRNSAAFLAQSFKTKSIKKTYLALVLGVVKKNEGEINIPLLKKKIGKDEKVYPDFEHGSEAISFYKVKKRFSNYSLLELQPITGKTHQLRVHTKEIGHAIIGDVKYGGKKAIMKNVANRLCLHAFSIEMQNYYGRKLLIESSLPDFLQKK
ncbi:MAG TPA: RluA family pseudouridine synthase, partial [Rickettsiales bacterium]|nr:RluA family pseudouridine synthase [Rickettsiales bacterium]